MQQMFEPQQLASPADFYPTVELTQPNWRSYGLAWFQQDFQGRKIDFHTGSLSGLIAIIGLDRANDKAVIVLGNRDHAEMRHALMWDVMDNTEGLKTGATGTRRFSSCTRRGQSKGRENWEETQQKRLKHTKPSLPRTAYAGIYRHPSVGDIRIEGSGSDMTLKTTLVDFEMSHWHLDTFPRGACKTWDMHEFASFNIDPEGSIVSVNVLGETFERVEEE